MNLKVILTSRFKKDYKLAIKRNLNIELLDDVFRIAGNVLELLLAIEELRACDKPEFIIVREFQHDVTSLLLVCYLLQRTAGGIAYLCVAPLFDLALFWP